MAKKERPADDDNPIPAILAAALKRAEPGSEVETWLKAMAKAAATSPTTEPHKKGERSADWSWKDWNSED